MNWVSGDSRRRGAALAVGLLVMAGLGMGSAQEVPVQAPACRDVAGNLVCGVVEAALAEATARVEAAKAEVEKARAAVEQAAEDAQAKARAQLEEAQAKLAAAQADLAAKLEEAKAQVEAAKAGAQVTADEKLREALLMGPVVVWTNKNMGPESGLDADTLDGRSSEYFLLAVEREAAARIAGDAVLGAALDAEAAARAAADGAEASARLAADAAESQARVAGDGALRAALDGEAASRAAADAGEADARRAADARLSSDLASEAGARVAADRAEQTARVAGDDAVRASVPDSAWGTVLARDGAGSGLDADRIDGLDSSAFYSAGSKVVDADRLDGLDYSQFLRRDTSDRIAGSLELAGNLGAWGGGFEHRWVGVTPYIDFSNDAHSDNDMRIILTGDDSMAIGGGALSLERAFIGGQDTGARLAVKGPIDRQLDLVSPNGGAVWDLYSHDNGNMYFVKFHGGLDAKFAFRPDGVAVAEFGPWATGGVDLAEFFEQAVPGQLQPHDLVCLAGQGKVRKCASGAEAPIGVTSSRPGFLGGESLEASKMGDPRYAVVGLLGQLEVRLPRDVKTGDLLAPDTFAKVIALEDGNAGDVVRVLLR